MQDDGDRRGDRWNLFAFYATVILGCLFFWGVVLYLCLR